MTAIVRAIAVYTILAAMLAAFAYGLADWASADLTPIVDAVTRLGR